MDMNTTLLVLASDARLASVPVCDVIDALSTTMDFGFTSIIKGNPIIAIPNMNVLCSRNDIHIIDGKFLAIGNPCYVGATGILNVWKDTIVVSKASRAILTETIGDDATKKVIYRD